jgi:hypothetical protein
MKTYLKMPKARCAIATLLLALTALTAHAQSYSIDWYKTSGGGGTSTGGLYSVSGTIGQPDASNAMTGGNYTVTGGFWSLLAVAQTLGAPLLTITHSGSSVIISWPVSPSGFTVQQNNNLANPVGWSAYGGTVSTNNGVTSITVTPPVGNLFFRLYHP